MRENIEAALRKSAESLFENESSPLLRALRLVRPNLRQAYVLSWIPEQAEDIYDVLVDKDTVCTVEVRRTSTSVSGEIKGCCSVHEYRLKNKSKEKNRKLIAALRMI